MQLNHFQILHFEIYIHVVNGCCVCLRCVLDASSVVLRKFFLSIQRMLLGFHAAHAYISSHSKPDTRLCRPIMPVLCFLCSNRALPRALETVQPFGSMQQGVECLWVFYENSRHRVVYVASAREAMHMQHIWQSLHTRHAADLAPARNSVDMQTVLHAAMN